jgi:AhpD family alkylhydroperoxidase
MQALEFTNTRFDPDLIDFHRIAQQMAKSVGYTADLSVDQQLAQLLRLRVAQMNPFSYCLILHTQAAHDQGVNPAKIAHLASWRESTMFTEAEQAVLAYCEGLPTMTFRDFRPCTPRLPGISRKSRLLRSRRS